MQRGRMPCDDQAVAISVGRVYVRPPVRPSVFDDEIFASGTRTVNTNFFNKAKLNLGSDSIQYRLPGVVNDKAGVYEIFTRPSLSGRTEMIMHRFFRPGR